MYVFRNTGVVLMSTKTYLRGESEAKSVASYHYPMTACEQIHIFQFCGKQHEILHGRLTIMCATFNINHAEIC